MMASESPIDLSPHCRLLSDLPFTQPRLDPTTHTSLKTHGSAIPEFPSHISLRGPLRTNRISADVTEDRWLDRTVGTRACDGPDLKRSGPKTNVP